MGVGVYIYMCVYVYVCMSVWVPLSLSSFERLVFSDLSFPLHGLFTEIAVCKFLGGSVVYGLKPFYYVRYIRLYIFLHLVVRCIVP